MTERIRKTRADRHSEFVLLRSQGRTSSNIADLCGLSVSYVRDVLNDPEGQKVRSRKLRYRGVCVDCGRSTSGSDGRSAAPDRCVRCGSEARRYWTRTRIIDAIDRWVTIYGEPPTVSEWGKSNPLAPAWRKKRMAEARGTWPELRVVQRVFGSWADAIEAAGYPRPRRGPKKIIT
jgi:hypothetical protein